MTTGSLLTQALEKRKLPVYAEMFETRCVKRRSGRDGEMTDGMGQVVGLKFRGYGPVYYFSSGGHDLAPGAWVLVETEQGAGIGEVVLVQSQAPSDMAAEELKPVQGVASETDLTQFGENERLGREAFSFCRELIARQELDMKLVDVEVLFDRSKILFYFTAPTRIDFRELVKDLVKNYHTRIELRQIGVRHETQMVGALGNCGMVCCCRRFLRKFAPVTIKMAKEQNLFLNPVKISGICGRLLCCLSYEQPHYEEFLGQCPKIGKKFLTSTGPVKVIRANIFSKTLTLIGEGGEEKEVTLEEWQAMNPRRPDHGQPAPGAPLPAEQGRPAPRPPRDAVGPVAFNLDQYAEDTAPEGGPEEDSSFADAAAPGADSGAEQKKGRSRRRRRRKPQNRPQPDQAPGVPSE